MEALRADGELALADFHDLNQGFTCARKGIPPRFPLTPIHRAGLE